MADLLPAPSLGLGNPLLNDVCRHLSVSISRNTGITPDNALPDDPLFLRNLVEVRLLVVLPVVLSPGDLPWVALTGPHSESLAGFEAQNVLVNANVEPAVTRVELVACKAVNLGLVRHSRERPATPSQFSGNFFYSS